MRVKRINYKNIWLLFVFVCCIGIIIHDLISIIFLFKCFTLYGFLTHLLAWYVMNDIYNYFLEKIAIKK